MILNYKFEIYPNEEQQIKLNSWINICRQQYNSALLDKINRYRSTKKSLKRMELQSIQTADKKVLPFLKEIPSQPLQEVFFRLEKAFEKFFRKEAKFPKQKKYKDYSSITFTQFGIGKQLDKKYNKLRTVRRAVSLGKGGKLQISDLGLVDIVWHRKLDGKIKQVIIKRQGSRWYAIFSVERRVANESLDYNKTTGLDVGIKKFAVLSNGETIENPKFLLQSEKQLKKYQRKLSKAKKGSNNYKKWLRKVQELHEKVANQRRDFLHKESYRLARDYSIVFAENLKITNMVRNRKLAKHIMDAGWGMFRTFLKYKCKKNGGLLHLVNPQYTSQNCSGCGTLVKKSLSVRTHICPSCGLVLDRDHNAAINIEKKGLEELNILQVA